MNKFKEIRPIVLGIAKNGNKILVKKGVYSISGKCFYRCLGKRIEFLKKSSNALKREFKEEIDIDYLIT